MTLYRSKSLLAKSILAAGLVSGLGLAQSVYAEDAPAAAAPAAAEPGPFTANVTLVNDYRYRGISQSNFNPAIQGGFDYAHESGFYIGNWNSSISWISDAVSTMPGGQSTSAPIEMDFYAGYKHDWSKGFIFDVGVLQYYYPTSGLPGGVNNPNTTELYVAQNFTALEALTGYLKFSVAVTNLFGTANSSGSNYTDLTLNYDTGVWGLALNGHVGYQYLAGSNPVGGSNNSLYSYTDWKLGVTKDLGAGFSLGLAYVQTNAKDYAYVNPQGNNLGRAGVLVNLTKTF
jgi:uncharacterized protein (TIGR02001 family)